MGAGAGHRMSPARSGFLPTPPDPVRAAENIRATFGRPTTLPEGFLWTWDGTRAWENPPEQELMKHSHGQGMGPSICRLPFPSAGLPLPHLAAV